MSKSSLLTIAGWCSCIKNLRFLHRLLAFARETTTSSTQKKIVGKFNEKLSHFSIGCDKMTTDNTRLSIVEVLLKEVGAAVCENWD